ncbi:MAG TPA: DUF2911 domain-containing protein [Opitutaceae bacterium]|nr:DUF2911 domain-containing protein [Opitutaceae bacterium]
MHKLRSALFVVVMSFLSIASLSARTSPHETVSAPIDGCRVTIVYGRPYSKDPKTGEIRKIWGKLVPYGAPWRTGSDEATLLITQKDIALGGVTIPAGAYTLYTQPEENGTAKLIVNKQIGQWGTVYDSKQDFARVDLKAEPLDPQIDEFTIAVEKNPAGGGLIKLMWEKTQFSVPFTVAK